MSGADFAFVLGPVLGVASGCGAEALVRRSRPIAGRWRAVLVTAAVLVVAVAAWRVGGCRAWRQAAVLVLATVTVPLSAVDLSERRIPDVVLVPAFALGVVLLGLDAVTRHQGGALVRAVLAVAVLYAGALALLLAARDSLGYGDVLTELDGRYRLLTQQLRGIDWLSFVCFGTCRAAGGVAGCRRWVGGVVVEFVARDVAGLVVPRAGGLVAVPGDRVLAVRLVDPAGVEVEAVGAFLRELRANDASPDTAVSYGKALLRWFRFLWAVEVPWERAGRVEARDFMLWLAEVPKPVRGIRADSPPPGSVNAITRRAYPGSGYAVRTRRHNRAVVRAFYEFHRERGSGPLVNPMPARRGRADAHHNPMGPFEVTRRADFQPRLARTEPVYLPDRLFDELFASLRYDRDRALVAFYISTAARAAELLTVTCDRVDVGQQLIGVVRKGSRAVQWLPASTDAFVWLERYRRSLGDQVSWRAGQPLWRTLRRPYRALTYPAARAVLVRANQVLGTNWTLYHLRHTAARRMIRDPRLTLADVQWVLGHSQITTTQAYTAPTTEDMVDLMHGHFAALGAPRVPQPPSTGYDPQMLRTLLGGAAP